MCSVFCFILGWHDPTALLTYCGAPSSTQKISALHTTSTPPATAISWVAAPPSLPCSPPSSCLDYFLLSQASPLHRDRLRSHDDGGMHSCGRSLFKLTKGAKASHFFLTIFLSPGSSGSRVGLFTAHRISITSLAKMTSSVTESMNSTLRLQQKRWKKQRHGHSQLRKSACLKMEDAHRSLNTRATCFFVYKCVGVTHLSRTGGDDTLRLRVANKQWHWLGEKCGRVYN